MKVPFLDLRRLHDSIRPELEAAFADALDASAFIGGPTLGRFEADFAAAHGRAHAVGCASGTDAISLALRAAGIGEGDEVVVPAMTFFASAEAVVHAGAVPVVADVDEETLLLTPRQVDEVRTERTRGVLPVHLYGHAVDFEFLRRWRSDGLVVLEDAAQAHLATWRGEPVGAVGHAACFSFFPGKNLGALGDAGAVVTDDEDLADSVRRQRDHGRTEKYVHASFGVSSRLDGLQAAFLAAKLRHLPAWTDARRRLAGRYRERLTGAADGLTLVPWEEGAVHHLLVVRVAHGRRDEVRRRLGEAGVDTGIHYPVPLSEQPPFRGATVSCPAASAAAAEVLSLPLDPLMSPDEVDLVCDLLLEHTR